MVYSPLAGGVLTGKYRPEQAQPPEGSRAEHWKRQGGRPSSSPQMAPRYLAAAAKLAEMAEARGQTAAQLALAWTMAHPAITAAVMGASSIAQLESNLPAFDIEMTPDERKELTQIIIDAEGSAK